MQRGVGRMSLNRRVSNFCYLISTLGHNENLCHYYADKFKAGSVIFMMLKYANSCSSVIVVFTLVETKYFAGITSVNLLSTNFNPWY